MIAASSSGHSPSAVDELADFQTFYRTHFAFVWRVLRRLGLQEGDVLDGVQEVFLVVHRSANTYEARAAMTTWLYAICLRVASTRRRAERRRLRFLGELVKTYRTHEPVDPTARVTLEQLLSRLPEALRTVYVLFEMEQLDGEDIAALLGLPLGTVRSRLRLARERLQQHVDRSRIQEHDAPRNAAVAAWTAFLALTALGREAKASAVTSLVIVSAVAATTVATIVLLQPTAPPRREVSQSPPMVQKQNPAAVALAPARRPRVQKAPLPPQQAKPTSALELQVAALVQAAAALEQGDGETALRLLAGDPFAGEESQVEEERQALFIRAQVALHRADDARARFATFERRFPNSAQRKALLEVIANAASGHSLP